MCQAIGTMQLDRDASPLGLVARAWCADVVAHGYVLGVDGSRRVARPDSVSERAQQLIEKLKGGKPVLTSQGEIEMRLARDAQEKAAAERVVPCPLCDKPTPKSEIDGSYPYECCINCYWELPG